MVNDNFVGISSGHADHDRNSNWSDYDEGNRLHIDGIYSRRSDPDAATGPRGQEEEMHQSHQAVAVHGPKALQMDQQGPYQQMSKALRSERC